MHAKREQMPGLKEDLDRYYHHRCTRLKASLRSKNRKFAQKFSLPNLLHSYFIVKFLLIKLDILVCQLVSVIGIFTYKSIALNNTVAFYKFNDKRLRTVWQGKTTILI